MQKRLSCSRLYSWGTSAEASISNLMGPRSKVSVCRIPKGGCPSPAGEGFRSSRWQCPVSFTGVYSGPFRWQRPDPSRWGFPGLFGWVCSGASGWACPSSSMSWWLDLENVSSPSSVFLPLPLCPKWLLGDWQFFRSGRCLSNIIWISLIWICLIYMSDHCTSVSFRWAHQGKFEIQLIQALYCTDGETEAWTPEVASTLSNSSELGVLGWPSQWNFSLQQCLGAHNNIVSAVKETN